MAKFVEIYGRPKMGVLRKKKVNGNLPTAYEAITYEGVWRAEGERPAPCPSIFKIGLWVPEMIWEPGKEKCLLVQVRNFPASSLSYAPTQLFMRLF
jgi:hypothetical protein